MQLRMKYDKVLSRAAQFEVSAIMEYDNEDVTQPLPSHDVEGDETPAQVVSSGEGGGSAIGQDAELSGTELGLPTTSVSARHEVRETPDTDGVLASVAPDAGEHRDEATKEQVDSDIEWLEVEWT